HKQRKQEESIYSGTRGGNNQERSGGADEQPEENASFVPDLFHEPAGGKSSQKVASKKGNLDKGRLKVREVECFLEMRNENVVQVDTDGPQKKQASDQHERENVFSFRQRSRLRRHIPSALAAPKDQV